MTIVAPSEVESARHLAVGDERVDQLQAEES
jgi:hypothetical protein